MRVPVPRTAARAAAASPAEAARRHEVLTVVVAAALAGASLWTIALTRHEGGPPPAGAATVVGAPRADASALAGDGGAAWTVGLRDRRLRPVGDATGARTVGAAGDRAAHLVARDGALWVALHRGGIGVVVRIGRDGTGSRVLPTGGVRPTRIAVAPGRVVGVGGSQVVAVPLRGAAGWRQALPGAADVAVGYRSVWTVSAGDAGTGLLTRRDPATGAVVGRRTLPAAPTAIAVGAGAVWIANGCANGVLRVPVGPGPGRCTGVGRGAADVVVGAGAAWAADAAGLRIVRLDAATGAATARWTTAGRPAALAVAGDRVVALTRGGGLEAVPVGAPD